MVELAFWGGLSKLEAVDLKPDPPVPPAPGSGGRTQGCNSAVQEVC
jgi:hypothetical protein